MPCPSPYQRLCRESFLLEAVLIHFYTSKDNHKTAGKSARDGGKVLDLEQKGAWPLASICSVIKLLFYIIFKDAKRISFID